MEDVERLVAIDGTVAVVSLKGVRLDDEKRLIVESCDLRGFPSEEVDVDVATPLSDDSRAAAVDHSDAVEDGDNGPVGLVGSAADVDDGEVTVRDDELGVRRVRERPNLKDTLPILAEAERGEGVASGRSGTIHVADELRRATSVAELLDVVLIKNDRTGIDEGFDIVSRTLGGHRAVGSVFGALDDVPVYAFERGTALPQPPEIAAGLLAGRRGGGIEAILVEIAGESLLFGLRRERDNIPVDIIPGDKEVSELSAGIIAGGEILVVEKVAVAIGRGLVDNHGAGAIEDATAGRADNVGGLLALGLLPYTHLGEMDESVVAAAARVGLLGRADLDLAIALGDTENRARLADAHHLRFGG